ncbi:DUF2500 domain-containing protein [Solibaculum mannosilyticum]|uniref:DUF2500 domain-containing protein n=1 Tax=Solibaculum mannosilyticum TaxID=2780922 RepID=UPI0034C15D9D
MDYDVVLVSFFGMFAVVIGLILIVIILQWRRNKRLPKLVVNAEFLEKRIQKVRHSRRGKVGYHTTYSRLYVSTFEVEGGEHITLFVKKPEYHKLKKGDTGKLSFQGTRYLGFEKAEGKRK